MEIAIRFERGMIVHENLKIAAHDKHVEQPFVNHLKLRHGAGLPRVVDGKYQVRTSARFRRAGRDVEIQMVLNRGRDAVDSFIPQRLQLPGV